ncbi:hypothetical protein ACLKA6_019937 [Drosophila palustris]
MALFVCFVACQFCFRVAATQCESTTIKRKVNLNAVKEEGMSSRVYVQLIRTAFKTNKGRIAKRKFDSKAKELKRKDDGKDYTDMDNGNKENEADFANLNVNFSF